MTYSIYLANEMTLYERIQLKREKSNISTCGNEYAILFSFCVLES